VRIALLFLLAGCTVPTAPAECGDEEFACFRGTFRTLASEPVEGVELCAPELDLDCVSSDVDGAWSMPGLPLDQNVFLTAEHADYVATLFPQHTSMDWYAWHKVAVPPFVLETHASRLGAELDDDRAQLLFLVWQGLNIDGVDTEKIAGVQGSLHAPSGDVFYADGFSLADANATETSGSGSGGALNLEPGEGSLSLTAAAGPCVEHSFSWQIGSDGRVPFPLRAGFATAIDVICPVE
jgi:hypothetical protein